MPIHPNYIDAAIQGAAECILWQATDATDAGNGFPISDGGNEYSERVIAEVPYLSEAVAAFVLMNAALILKSGLNGGQVGHDLILTANGHGTGFWDRGLGDVGDALSEACEGYSFDAEFAMDENGYGDDVVWLMVENIVLVSDIDPDTLTEGEED